MSKLLTALVILFTATLHAQITSGTITYEFSIKSNEPNLSEQADPDPKNRLTIDFNEHYIRTKFISLTSSTYGVLKDKTTGYNIYYATDPETKTICFYDLNAAKAKAEKRKQEYDHKDLTKSKFNDTVVEITDETKEILGLRCKKTILTIRNETITIWSTDDIEGLENVYKLAPNIKATIISYYLTSEDLIVHYDAVEFSKTNTIDEKSFYSVPQNYSLELGRLYLKSDVDAYNVEELLEIPAFITFPSSKETIDKITHEMDQSFHFGAHKSTPVSVEMNVFFNEKGTITSVEFEQEESEETNAGAYNKKELAAAVKKNCSLKTPVTVNGKATPVILKIDYSFEGNLKPHKE